MGRILVAGNSGKVGSCVATPVAQKSYDLRLKLVRHFSLTPKASNLPFPEALKNANPPVFSLFKGG
jgi:hypothetical protein